MNNEYLAISQTIISMQKNLIDIEIALNNKTMTFDSARNHIKQISAVTKVLEDQYKCESLTKELREATKKLAEQTTMQYKASNANNFVR